MFADTMTIFFLIPISEVRKTASIRIEEGNKIILEMYLLDTNIISYWHTGMVISERDTQIASIGLANQLVVVFVTL